MTVCHLQIWRIPYSTYRKRIIPCPGSSQIYISLLRDKFAEANKRLVERLGEANWQRNLNIWNHLEQIDGSAGSGSIAVPTDLTAGSILQPQAMIHDSRIGTSVPAQSCSVSSESSPTPFISGLADKEDGAAKVPQTPTEVGFSTPLRCYPCGQMQLEIKSRVDWKWVAKMLEGNLNADS